MRRAGALDVGPGIVAVRMRAAIDDQPFLADGNLQRQRAGMSRAVDTGRRRRTAIDEHDGAVADQPLVAAVRR